MTDEGVLLDRSAIEDAQVLELLAEIFPEEEVPPRARLILEGIFDPEQS